MYFKYFILDFSRIRRKTRQQFTIVDYLMIRFLIAKSYGEIMVA